MILEKGLVDVILKVLVNKEVFRSKGDEVAIDVST